MPRRRGVSQSIMPSVPPGPTIWLRADYEFPGTFSYRQPDASAQFAIGVPIPSPATVKLALVDTAIRWSGRINEGRRIFDLVKTLRVCVIPPCRLVKFRAFIRRLKPPHAGSKVATEESVGVRDYFLLNGPMQVYIEVPEANAEEIKNLLHRIRRLGTSDSLCWCRDVKEEAPPENLCPRTFRQISTNTAGLIVQLSDLTPDSQFDGFNPFGGNSKQAHLQKNVYILPLRVVRNGETWTIYELI